jgi:GPH family glycoside/pentoside/hexuronide:cation symporter
MLREMRHTLSNRAFLWLVFAALFGFVNQGIAFSLTNYIIGFVWEFGQGEKTAYALMLFLTMIAAFIVVAPLARKFGKREGAIIAGAISLAFNTALYLLYYLDLFPMVGGRPSIVLIFTLVFIANVGAITMSVLSSSMMADVVEASQSETGRRSEGLFFAGYFFMQKCATGIGIFIAGQILSFALFPPGAKPGEIGSAVLSNLAIGYLGAILVVGFAGLLVMRRFPINRADHEARLAKLDAEAKGDLDGTHILP